MHIHRILKQITNTIEDDYPHYSLKTLNNIYKQFSSHSERIPAEAWKKSQAF